MIAVNRSSPIANVAPDICVNIQSHWFIIGLQFIASILVTVNIVCFCSPILNGSANFINLPKVVDK